MRFINHRYHHLIIIFTNQLLNFDGKKLIRFLVLWCIDKNRIFELGSIIFDYVFYGHEFRLCWFVYFKYFLINKFRRYHFFELDIKFIVHVFKLKVVLVYYYYCFIKVIVYLLELFIEFTFFYYKVQHLGDVSS